MRKYKFLLFLLPPLALWSGLKTYEYFTDGFSVSNIVYDLSIDLRRPVAHPLDNREDVASILSQDYYYLTKGRQSYVFESKDGKYVLKFFKYQRFRPMWHQDYLSWIPHVNALHQSRNLVCRDKLEKLFSGCQIAYEDLADLTGVIYLKLDSTPAPASSVTIHDKLGLSHQISLDEMQFIIQQKAESFSDAFDTLIKQDQPDKAEELVLKMIDLLAEECERGFMDLDPLIVRNTGVIGGNPVHLDIGQITRAKPSEEVFQRDDFRKKVESYIGWVRAKDTEMAARIEDAVKNSAFWSQLAPLQQSSSHQAL